MKPDLTKQLKRWSAMAAGILFLAGSSGSCTSTEVIQPEPPADSNTISIAVSTPEALPGTKADGAHTGMKLRYTAKLFKGDTPPGAPAQDPANEKFVARQEIVPEESGTNTFVFTAEQGKYCVAIFSDYIDASATKDENGHYTDKYYDTTSTTDYTNMLAFHSKDGHVEYNNLINNEDFDCFYALHKLTKDINVYETDVTLTRAVCKIRLCTSSNVLYGVDKIELTKMSYLSEFSHINKGSGIQNNVEDGCLPEAFAPNGGADNELFWFYSFGSHGKNIGNIAFTISGKEGWEFKSVLIPSGSIKDIKANFRYKVTGDFLQATKYPSNEIRIIVDNNENWEENEGSKTVTVSAES